MSSRSPRIDAYIAQAAPFAQPILTHLRELVHQTCPNVQETWKWSFPHFDYEGSILVSMAAFKQHCAFTCFKYALIDDKYNIFNQPGETAMGQLGKIKTLADLPKDKILKDYIKQAMKLNEAGVKLSAMRPKPVRKGEVEVPNYLTKALKKNKAALKVFEAFTPGKRKEYILWFEEAKTDATREKRLTTALEWISEGKTRNWKYEKTMG